MRDSKCCLLVELLHPGIQDFPPGPGRMPGMPGKSRSLFPETGEMICFFFRGCDL